MIERRQGSANFIEKVVVRADTLRFGLRGQRRNLSRAYIMFTLQDSTEPIVDIPLTDGRIPRQIVMPKPADICTFRLIATEQIAGTEVSHVQPGLVNKKHTYVMKKGWQIHD